MLGAAIATIEFVEPSLTVAVPGCAEAVAAALSYGYRLAPGPTPNHEDVIGGPTVDRLIKIREARQSTLTRTIRWHFLSGSRPLTPGTEPVPIRAFFRLWSEDRHLRVVTRDSDRFKAFYAEVIRQLSKKDRRAAVAAEGSRTAVGKFNGQPEALRDFNRLMDQSHLHDPLR